MHSFRIAVDFHKMFFFQEHFYCNLHQKDSYGFCLTIHMHHMKKSESTVITSFQSEFLQGLYSPH